jgi:hypothetical protein
MDAERQALPFDAPPPHDLADTSRAAFEAIRPDLNRRERIVFRALHRFIRERRYEPTSRELLRAMQAWPETKAFAVDVNSVRPRLSGLDDKGWVIKVADVTRDGSHPYRPVLPESAVPADDNDLKKSA